jgi:hypothetical protein
MLTIDSIRASLIERSTRDFLGFIAYEGPSMIDGSPIVVIINKIDAASDNGKTGALVQSFIIRSDVPPTEALKSGDDSAVCGDCKHRPLLAAQTGDAPCYVNVGRSVRAVYDAYKRGRYVRAPLETIALALADKHLRIGTYGDGAAAPAVVWHRLIRYCADWVGYTHQWARADFVVSDWAGMVMASVDSMAEYAAAKALGMRTFRVAQDEEKAATEARCPASKEMGQRTTCNECLLCSGTSKRARDIVIIDHAIGHKRRVIRIAPAA